MIEHWGTRHVVGLKLGHLRQLSSPFEVIEFESERGKGMWAVVHYVLELWGERDASRSGGWGAVRRCGKVFGGSGQTLSSERMQELVHKYPAADGAISD